MIFKEKEWGDFLAIKYRRVNHEVLFFIIKFISGILIQVD